MNSDENVPPVSGISHSGVHRKKSLEELMQEQDVKPVSRFEELLGVDVWPPEDDIDEFCRTIRRWREQGSTDRLEG